MASSAHPEASASGPLAAVSVRHLRLHNFRNYADAQVELAPGLNLFIGHNAQGKSNLLEAMVTLLLVRSPRATSAADLLRWGTQDAAVDALVTRATTTETLGLRLHREPAAPGDEARAAGPPRVTRVSTTDGRAIAAREMIGRCPLVVFWPDDLQLLKAGPDARRRLVDTLLSQVEPEAADALVRYRRVLEQRNRLLRDCRGGQAPPHLAAFDEALVRHGARVQAARTRVVTALSPIAGAAMTRLTAGGDHLELRHRPDSSNPGDAEEAIAASLHEALGRSLALDVHRGLTLAGPHRDDVDFLLNGRPARLAASQGQLRSAVLATKMAEVRWLERRSGQVPVVLLDDVLSELDPVRGAHLVEALAGADPAPQTIMTAAHLPDLGGHGAARYAVENATITPR
jgi:DNA replication and repair protein RecF